jgi:MFS family permease
MDTMISRQLNSIVSIFKNNEALLILCAQVSILHIGIGLISPILPLYAKTFGVSVTWVGFLLTAQFLPRIIIDLPIGGLADRWGAHRLLVISSLATVFLAVAAGLAPNYWVLLLIQLLQGISIGTNQISGFTYTVNVSKPENRARAISLYQGSTMLGHSIGPVIGGFSAMYLGYRAPFFIYALLALAAGIWMILRLKEPRQSAYRSSRIDSVNASFMQSLRQMLRHRGILFGSLIGFFAFCTRAGSRNMGVPLRGDEIGLTEGQIGFAMTLIFVGNFVTLYLAGSLADRFGIKKVIVPSWLMTGGALMFLSLSSRTEFFLLAALLFGLTEGLALPIPVMYVVDASGEETQGIAMGIYRLSVDIGLAVGPILMGFISERSSVSNGMIINSFAFIAIAFGLFLFAPEMKVLKTS